jgi:DNA-directed RNA polymerase specialized sigma24 family protein
MGQRFATTHWTLVIAAGNAASPDAERALAALCETYWLPVYAFIRRGERDADDAKDLTQAFFTLVLEKHYFAEARQDRGKFRSFLLTAVTHFLANQHDWNSAKKRGGGQHLLPLEFDAGERTFLREPVDAVTPERLYERRWALAVIDAAMQRVSKQYEQNERADLFGRLQPYLTGEEPASYAELAAALSSTENALRVAVHRLRRQFASSLREVVAETVARPDEVEGELRHLLKAVSAM